MPGPLFVETYRPAFNGRPAGIKVRVHKGPDFSTDVISPSTTSVFRIEGARTKEEALALVIEKLAGKNVTVYQLF